MGTDSNSIGKGPKAAGAKKANVTDEMKDAAAKAGPVLANATAKAARNYNELMMTSALSIPDVAADAVVLNSITSTRETFPPPTVKSGPSVLNKTFVGGSAVLGTASFVYAANRLPTTGRQLVGAYDAWRDPNADPGEKFEATAVAADAVSVTSAGVWSGAQVAELGKDKVAKAVKLVMNSGGGKKATAEITEKAAQVVAKQVTTEVAKEGLSFFAKRIVPGAAIATAAADTTSAAMVVFNPETSTGEKLGASMTARGSITSSTATILLLAPEPIITKAIGIGLMVAGVSMSVGGSYLAAHSAGEREEASKAKH